MTALSQAIRNKRWRQARLLIEAGSDINWKGQNKRSVIMEVCFLDDEEKALGLAKMLLKNGADLNFQDEQGLTTLSYACILKRKKLVALFLQYVDYDLNAVDRDGNTALFHAITVGDISATNFNSTSDVTLKQDVSVIDNALEMISQLEGVSWKWKETLKPSLGVTAQNVETVAPELVSNGSHKSVNYNGLIGILIEAVKELKSEVDELKR